MFGQTLEYKLASLCYPAYTIGIGSLEVCTTNLSIDTDSRRLSFDLLVKLCLGRWGVERCWELARERVSISWFTFAEMREVNPDFEGFNEDLLEKVSRGKAGSHAQPLDYKIYKYDSSERHE